MHNNIEYNLDFMFDSTLNYDLQKSEKVRKDEEDFFKINSRLMLPDEEMATKGFNGTYEKFGGDSFNVLRSVAEANVIINSIINTRCHQTKSFTEYSDDDAKIGWMIRLKDRDARPTDKDKKTIDEIAEWIENTGKTDFDGADLREDTFTDIVEQLTREQLTIDQVATEIRYDRAGRLLDFWILDAATIKRLRPEKTDELGNKYRFCQEMNSKIYTLYRSEDIVFDYQNKRADIRYKGYGYPYIEQAVDAIINFTYGMSYNKNQFTESALPKGFISLENANMPQEKLDEARRKFERMFSGTKGMHKVAFLGHKASWQSLAGSNKEMEFKELIQLVASFICSAFSIDSAELGLRFNQAQNVLNENQNGKMAFSKDRGLKQLLNFIRNFMNKIIKKNPEWSKYEFIFTGLADNDKHALQELDEKQIKSYKTVNEKRAEKDLEPIDGGDIILDPTYYQSYTMQQQNEQEAGQEDDMGAFDDQGTDEEEDFDFSDEDYDDILGKSESQKLLKSDKKISIKIKI